MVEGKENARLMRVFWYEVGSIDEWALDDKKVENTLFQWFLDDKELKSKYLALAGIKLKNATQDEIKAEAWAQCLNEVKSWYSSKKALIKKSTDFHFGVRSSTDFIDIIPSGHLKVDILNKNVSEKGLDTSLAVDMLSLVDTYDVAIIISGDADTIPSIERVKNMGKQVGVVEFIKGYPPEKKGRQSSSKLKAIADFVVPVYEVDLKKAGVAFDKPSHHQ